MIDMLNYPVRYRRGIHFEYLMVDGKAGFFLTHLGLLDLFKHVNRPGIIMRATHQINLSIGGYL